MISVRELIRDSPSAMAGEKIIWKTSKTVRHSVQLKTGPILWRELSNPPGPWNTSGNSRSVLPMNIQRIRIEPMNRGVPEII
jgi:hypothetical protein